MRPPCCSPPGISTDRRLPDKAIDLMDEAASQVRMEAAGDPGRSCKSPGGEGTVRLPGNKEDCHREARTTRKPPSCRDAEKDFQPRRWRLERFRWQRRARTTPVVTAQ
ncbi:MAG: hypothetical protein ACLT9P_07020 [Evtepia gabavorous]